jgi:hypothetical protein
LRQEQLIATRRLIQSELALLRQLACDRRLASIHLPVLARSGRGCDRSHSKGQPITRSPAATTRSQLAPLSANEEISLRRVAHGQSDVARLRAQDLVRLKALHLITADPRQPVLTAEGKRRFDALPKPAPVATFDAESEMMAQLDSIMGRPGAGGRGRAIGKTEK